MIPTTIAGNTVHGSRFKMRLPIAGHTVEGLYDVATVDLPPEHALIYIVVGIAPADRYATHYHILDVGETDQPGRVLANHPRRADWHRARGGPTFALICLLPPEHDPGPAERQALVETIRRETRSHPEDMVSP